MTDEMIDQKNLEMLAKEVDRLPRSIEPPDAWPGIRAAIQSETFSGAAGSKRGTAAVRFWQQPAFLAAAAFALIASTSTATVIALRNSETPESATRAQPAVPAILVQFTARENDYIQTANRLAAILDSQQTSLAPETIAKLKQSLAIIDAAILEAREALAADPANRQLIEMLSSSYDKKLDLLRRSAAMARS